MDRSRVMILAALLLLPLGGLQARLVQLQIVEAPASQGDLSSKRAHVELTYLPRGRILDARGRVLAEDRRSFDFYLVLEDFEKAPWPVPEILRIPADRFQEAYEEIYAKIEKQVRRRPANERRRLYQRERRTPYLVWRDIPFETAVRLETSPDRFPGSFIKESLKRVYPFPGSPAYRPLYPDAIPGAQLLGYLSRVTSNEREFRDMLQDGKLFPGFEELIGQDGIAQLFRRGEFNDALVGRSGVERKYDDLLRAKPGLVVIERRAGTSEKNVIELKPAEAGADAHLTIDIDVQEEVERILAGPLPAAAAVLDAKTGAVVALASNRSYDPNAFIAPGDPAAVRRVLQDDEGKPLQSRAFAQQFQLGSIFKTLTALAGLEEKKVAPGEALPCRGRFDERIAKFNCWIWNEYRSMHGEVSLHDALARSCNCYFYETGKRLGMEDLLKWSRALGFGEATGLDLPGEVAGRLPGRSRWENDVLSLAIGQHELMVSPLQSAVLMAAVANGGLRVTPHVRQGAGAEPRPLGLSPGTIREIRQGLYEVVNSVHGTAHKTDLKNHAAAGKTSTAQGGGGKNHAWFGGYAPHDDPRVAVVVFVEGGGHGGEAAAPLASRILDAVKKAK